MVSFSSNWKSSVQPRKQRKYRRNAPLHIRQKFVHSHLSSDLRKKHGKRGIGLRKGDTVMVMRGKFRKKTGKVEEIDLKKSVVYVSGMETTKKDGTKVRLPLHPSKLMITELGADDKKRQKTIGRKANVGSP